MRAAVKNAMFAALGQPAAGRGLRHGVMEGLAPALDGDHGLANDRKLEDEQARNDRATRNHAQYTVPAAGVFRLHGTE
jgi:hypothetical protein